MGDLRKKRDYKLSNFQRTTNLTQHVLDCLVLKSGADRDRTDDLLLAKQALSQLSYSPVKRLWARKELNLRPHAYQACALTS